MAEVLESTENSIEEFARGLHRAAELYAKPDGNSDVRADIALAADGVIEPLIRVLVLKYLGDVETLPKNDPELWAALKSRFPEDEDLIARASWLFLMRSDPFRRLDFTRDGEGHRHYHEEYPLSTRVTFLFDDKAAVGGFIVELWESFQSARFSSRPLEFFQDMLERLER